MNSRVSRLSESGYMSHAFAPEDEIVSRFKRYMPSHVEFDTFVGIGLSGTLVAPLLARALDKHFAIARKDDGSHSNNCVEGTMGERWLFVDDLISTGATFKMARERIKAEMRFAHEQPEFAGVYLYNGKEGFSAHQFYERWPKLHPEWKPSPLPDTPVMYDPIAYDEQIRAVWNGAEFGVREYDISGVIKF